MLNHSLNEIPIQIIYFDNKLDSKIIFSSVNFLNISANCDSFILGMCKDDICTKVSTEKCVAKSVLDTGFMIESSHIFTEPLTGIIRTVRRFGFPSFDGGCYEIRIETKDPDVAKNTIIEKNMQDNFRLIASGINHEVRSPLQALYAYLEMLEILHNDKNDIFVSMRLELEKIVGILDSLGKFNRNDKSVSEYDVFSKIIEDTWKTVYITLLPSHPIVLDLDFIVDDFGDIVANIPKAELQQIFTNILRNSVEALNKKRSEISVKLVSKNEEFFSFLVRDNGSGIPNQILTDIFIPFVTSKNGMGLGLTICRYFILSRGGTIFVLSEEDEFTEIIISLPIRNGG